MKLAKFLIFVLFFSFSNLSRANFFKETSVGRNIISEIKNLSISTKLDILDFQSDAGIATGIKYKYRLEPSFISNKFARLDEWTMTSTLNIGDVLDGVSPIHFNVNKGSKVIFLRNFDDQWEGIKAAPYTIRNIPTNAKNTLTRLNKGDFVSFPANLNINLGVGQTINLFPYDLSADVSVMASGQFTTYIYKIDETHVRLKLVAQTQVGRTSSVGTDFALKFTGLSLVDKKIEKIVELDLFKASSIAAKGEQYILDYIFDLSNPRAQEAFDNIISPKKKLNLSDMILKYSGIEYMEKKLVSDYGAAEVLHYANDGVTRVFKGFNNFKFKKSEYKIGLLVARASKGVAYFRNNITIEDREGEIHSFFFPNRVHFYKEETKAFFLKRKDKFETSFYGLIPVNNETSNYLSVANLGISHWREDDFLTRKEWRNIKQELFDLLPTEITKDIDFSQLETRSTKQNTKVRLQILFKDTVFDNLKDTTFEQVYELLESLLKERTIITKTKIGGFVVRRYKSVKNFLGVDSITIHSFAKKFHYILTDRQLSSAQRIEKFLELPDSYLFKRYGVKLFLYLLDPSQWEQSAFIDLEVIGNELMPVTYKLGTLEFSEVFKQILQANKEFYSPSNDLRIIAE